MRFFSSFPWYRENKLLLVNGWVPSDWKKGSHMYWKMSGNLTTCVTYWALKRIAPVSLAVRQPSRSSDLLWEGKLSTRQRGSHSLTWEIWYGIELSLGSEIIRDNTNSPCPQPQLLLCREFLYIPRSVSSFIAHWQKFSNWKSRYSLRAKCGLTAHPVHHDFVVSLQGWEGDCSIPHDNSGDISYEKL